MQHPRVCQHSPCVQITQLTNSCNRVKLVLGRKVQILFVEVWFEDTMQSQVAYLKPAQAGDCANRTEDESPRYGLAVGRSKNNPGKLTSDNFNSNLFLHLDQIVLLIRELVLNLGYSKKHPVHPLFGNLFLTSSLMNCFNHHQWNISK